MMIGLIGRIRLIGRMIGLIGRIRLIGPIIDQTDQSNPTDHRSDQSDTADPSDHREHHCDHCRGRWNSQCRRHLLRPAPMREPTPMISPKSIAAILFLLTIQLDAAPPPASGVEFYETHIRPLLSRACYECHSAKAKRLKGGLRLDAKRTITEGGDGGRIITPGNPDGSRLIQAIRYNQRTLQMPPRKRLAASDVKLLEQWVQMGAPMPDDAPEAVTATRDPLADQYAKALTEHWAWQPIQPQTPPAVKDPEWSGNPIDRFIKQKLDQAGITPNPIADDRTFIRRVYFDLLGLPPSFDEIQLFAETRNALIDDLLNSPHYDERWARHWLDIARYADTSGYRGVGRETRFPYSYTYRDYVIRSFNRDLPYNRFILEQIAADRLDLPADSPSLAAMGFLTVGKGFLNKKPEIIDDRLDVVFRGVMGLSLQCARCHDHKYDPIPIADYYSLYGVFDASQMPRELPTIGGSNDSPAYKKYLEELAKHEAKIQAELKKKWDTIVPTLKDQIPVYLYHALLNPDKAKERKGELRRHILNEWRSFLLRDLRKTDPVYAPIVSVYHGRNQPDFPAYMAQQLTVWKRGIVRGQKVNVNPHVIQAIEAANPKTPDEAIKAFAELLRATHHDWRAYKKSNPNATKFADATKEQLRMAMYREGVPCHPPVSGIRSHLSQVERGSVERIERVRDKFKIESPGAPARAMVMRDVPNRPDPRIFLRGDFRRPGPSVKRQFLHVIERDGRKPFSSGSGRLEMAQAIIDPSNPLTARVWVNRVWMHHFGYGLVRTPGDFGTRGQAPTHPELLDYLATEFMKNNWSTKWLHRLIMSSRTYQQTSAIRSDAHRSDPENRLVWRYNRRRLNFEAMRDSMLKVSNSLDLKMYGRPIDIIKKPTAMPGRRTIYGFIDRDNVAELLRTFDFANVDQSTPKRPNTTTPQQTLFMLNSPFLHECSKRLAALPVIVNGENAFAKVDALYRAVYQRNPSAEERTLAVQFIRDEVRQLQAGNSKRSPLLKLSQILLTSNEFMFVD